MVGLSVAVVGSFPAVVDPYQSVVVSYRKVVTQDFRPWLPLKLDVLIQPDIARYGTFDYDKVPELMQRGEEAARAQISAIKQLIAPHPRKPLRAQ